jgi:hypothetical protein
MGTSAQLKATAFLQGYMHKEADWLAPLLLVGQPVGDIMSDIADKSLTAAVALPVAAGAAAGYGASKLTSPGAKFKTTQKALVAAELEELEVEMRRKRAIALIKERMRKQEQRRGEKTLHL